MKKILLLSICILCMIPNLFASEYITEDPDIYVRASIGCWMQMEHSGRDSKEEYEDQASKDVKPTFPSDWYNDQIKRERNRISSSPLSDLSYKYKHTHPHDWYKDDKPMFPRRIHGGGEHKSRDSSEHKDVPDTSRKYGDSSGYKIAISASIGKHLNELFSIEMGADWHTSDNFQAEFILRGQNKEVENSRTLLRLYGNNFNIVNAMIRPVININITDTASLYFTTGIGGSYILSVGKLCFDKHFSLDDGKTQHFSVDGESLNKGEVLINDALNKVKDRLHFAWEVGGGATFAATDQTSIDISYKYKRLGQFALTENISSANSKDLISNMAFHSFNIGVRYNF